MAVEKYIPIATEAEIEAHNPFGGEASKCAGDEPYALMVLGDSMEPEFEEGDIIVIDPSAPVRDGSYVIAHHDDDYIFRQLVVRGEKLYITPLNPAYPTHALESEAALKGVITQKKKRDGSRRDRKFYS